MAERISKQILEVEYKTTGDIAPAVQKLETLQQAAKEAQGDTLKLVEAENKLRNAAIEAGKAVETQTTKQTAFQKSVSETGKAMNSLAQTNKLKEAFTGSAQQIQSVNDSLKKFEQAARSAKTVDELTQSVNELMDALPTDVRDEAVKLLDKEFTKLDKTIERPTARLRELKRLIATTDDPVLLRRYNEEAGELTDRLGDNNDLIKALASDTFFTDSLVESAQLAVSGFTAFQGALALVSEDQEELARAAQKAQGALALLQGTQTLLNELKKQDNVLTRAQIISQKIYTAAVGESVGVTKAFRIALLATGIGALVVAVGLLAANWDKVKDAVLGTTQQQRLFSQIQREAIKGYASEKVELDQLVLRYKNSSDNLEERKAVIQRLQEINPSYFKNLSAEKTTYDQLASSVNTYVAALRNKAIQEAALTKLTEIETRRLEIEQNRLDFITQQLNVLNRVTREGGDLAREQAFINNRKAFFERQLKEIDQESAQIQSIIDRNQTPLNFFTPEGEGANNSGARDRKVLEGSIAFFEKQVSDLSKKLNEDLIANSSEFFETIPLFREAQKQLEEAKKALGEPADAEVFTAGSLNALKKQASELEALINNLPDGGQLEAKAAELRKVQEDIEELQAKIRGPQAVEKTRNIQAELLEEERRFQLEVLDITEATEEQKLQLQLRYAKERLNALLEEKGDEVEIQKAENLIDALELRLKKIQGTQKATTEELIQGFQQVIQAAAQAAQQFIQIKQQENQQLIGIQQERVNRAAEIADEGNAEILQVEQERLDKLNAQQRKFAQQQVEIATIQLVAESALAIARAAAAGGPLAPFTIASTLIALAAGFASARAQANAIGQQASFRKGGYTGDGDPNAVSTALGNKGYEYHKGEYVMPFEVTSIGNNKKIFEDIRLKRIDLQKYFEPKSPTVIVNSDQKQVVDAIHSIPGVQFNIDKNGIYTIVQRKSATESKRQRIKGR